MPSCLSHTLFLISILCCTSCALKRSLPAGALVYKGSKYKIEKNQKNINAAKLSATYNALLKSPKPNKKILGTRFGLRFYNLFYTKKQKGLFHWLQNKLGEPPVIFDEQLTEQMEKVLENKAFNNGFFNSKVNSEIKIKRRWATIKYYVEIERPYVVHSVANIITDSLLKKQINAIQNTSLLKLNEPYNLALLKKERERITTALRQKGYYFFRDDYLKFLADTTQEKNQVHLKLALKKIPDSTHLSPKKIHQILLYPDLNVIENSDLLKDTNDLKGIKIIYRKELMRHNMLRQAVAFKKGELYSLQAHQNTLERLSFLRNYQFIDVQFKQSRIADSLLDVAIRLTPRKRDAVEGAVGLSYKSGLYFGPELSLTYLNRNLFRGAEQLRFTTFGNYSFPLADDVATLQEQGFMMELSKPDLIFPFRKKDLRENLVAKTKAALTYSSERVRLPLNGLQVFLEEEGFTDLLERLEADSSYSPFIALNNYEFNFTYQWRKRPDIQHEFSPINFVLQSPRYEAQELRGLLLLLILLDDSSEGLLLNLEKMLITKPSYTYLYDGRLKKIKQHNYFYRGKAAIFDSRLLSQDNLIPSAFLESQFLQLENDFRYFWRFSDRQTIGFRFASKVSIPFQDEIILPFFDLYNVGGPNSIRAFQPRQVGPGSVEPTTETFFLSGIGDVLLESSLEWRPKLSDLVELGLFLDAGNVWLLDGGASNNELADFRFANFYRQLAIGTGLGIRFDFDILLLRFDFAFPLSKPWLPTGDRWVGDEIDILSQSWRRENLTFNLAFGYSF